MKIEMGEGLSYDDVLLEPAYSEVLPSEVSTRTRLTGTLELEIPVLSAAMDTVTGWEMAAAMADSGGSGVVHRNLSPEEQAEEVRLAVSMGGGRPAVGAAVAPSDYDARIPLLMVAGASYVVMDTAHGDSADVLRAVERIKDRYRIPVVGGNVATAGGARRLIEAGADAVKVGVGPGSICTTRVVAGVGVPQLTAVINCAEECGAHRVPLIADGGIRYSGDIVKALAAGADTVMLGNMLAGLRETPGRVFEQEGRLYKVYRGMGSESAMADGGAERYQSTGGGAAVPEGVEGIIPLKGALAGHLHQLVQGLRKGMGYLGAPDLTALRTGARFIRLTGAALRESHPHSLAGFKGAANYRQVYEEVG
jgi:IMP dehydrogenase